MNEIVTWLLGSDPAEKIGRGDWSFGFVAQYGNYVNLALIAVFLAMVYLIVRSYRREGENPTRAKVILGGIRILVCLLVLLVVFRPAIVLRFTRTLFSTVVVLIDDSRSMSFTDRYTDAATRAELCGRLGVAPAELEELSRTEIVRSSLTDGNGIIERLTRDHPLMLMQFSTDKPGQESYTRPMGLLAEQSPEGQSEADANESAATAAVSVGAIMDRLKASGHETNLSTAIRDAIESVLGRRVAGIVLVSDGQMTSSGSHDRLADAVAYANQQGVRLYPVLVGDPILPKNVSVTGLQTPPEILRGTEVDFTVALAYRNAEGESATVKLLRRPKDKETWTDTGLGKTVVLESKSKTPSPTGIGQENVKGVQTVVLQLDPNEIGEFVYRAVVEPLPDERNTEDNAAESAVKISDEKIKILLVSGDAGWEFQYLRNMLLRQPDLYRVSVWQQNADKDVNQNASALEMRLNRLPATLAEFVGSPGGKPHPGYDVVILYDPEPRRDGFDKEFETNLRTFVERHGGGLCYIAGNKHSTDVLLSEEPFEKLSTMLPVVLGATTNEIIERISQRRPEAWPVQVTSEGAEHPVTRLGGSTDESMKIWQQLPGIYWSHPVLKAKPLVRTLAVTSNPLRRTGKNKSEPLLVTQPFGMGRVLYVGFDGTWRWRFVRDGYYHRLFWSNVVRYLATLQARQVVITAGGDRFSAGERVTIEVEAYDESFSPLKDAEFEVEMVDRATGESEKIVLESVAGKPGRYAKTIRAAKMGTFELTALKGDPMADEKVQSKTIRVELPKAESLRTEADRGALLNIASRPENFLGIHQIDKLAELIPADSMTDVREVPWELWDSNLTLLLIVVLLGVEWVLRKKYNMA